MAFEIQVEPSHYSDLTYDRKDRFLSYWHQIDEILKRGPESMLEVGIGNGFTSRYLSRLGVNVHTLDFDERLEPDTVGSVLELPFDDGEFEMSCCFETLEHLPWDVFAPSIRELKRVARRWVLVSLPDVTPYVRLDVNRSRKEVAHVLKDLPNPMPEEHTFDGQHYWEIGKKEYSLDRVVTVFKAEGLEVEEVFRVFEMPYHRFICCRVR